MAIPSRRLTGAYLSAIAHMLHVQPCANRCLGTTRRRHPARLRSHIQTCWDFLEPGLTNDVQSRMLRCLYWRDIALPSFADFCQRYFNGLNVWCAIFQETFQDWCEQESQWRYTNVYRLTKAFLTAQPLISPAEGRYVVHHLGDDSAKRLNDFFHDTLINACLSVSLGLNVLSVEFTSSRQETFQFA